jgi:hypothetical protein
VQLDVARGAGAHATPGTARSARPLGLGIAAREVPVRRTGLWRIMGHGSGIIPGLAGIKGCHDVMGKSASTAA